MIKTRPKTAQVGDFISWEMRNYEADSCESIEIRGTVEKIYTNSVLVSVHLTPALEALEVEERTVVNHKRYMVVNELY